MSHRSAIAALALAAALATAPSATAGSANAMIPISPDLYNIGLAIHNPNSSGIFMAVQIQQLDAQSFASCSPADGAASYSAMTNITQTYQCYQVVDPGKTVWLTIDPALLDRAAEFVRVGLAWGTVTVQPTITAFTSTYMPGDPLVVVGNQWELNIH